MGRRTNEKRETENRGDTSRVETEKFRAALCKSPTQCSFCLLSLSLSHIFGISEILDRGLPNRMGEEMIRDREELIIHANK